MMSENKIEKKNKLSKKNIIIIIAACLIIPILIGAVYISYLLFWRQAPTFVSSNNSDEAIQLGLPTAEESGVENIVLFGVDNRTPTDHGRTDSIIIATIDQNNKSIKLTSVMRDLYVDIGVNDKQMNRVNAAYAIGGPDRALQVLNKNLGLDLKHYAIIDFKAFQDLVEKLGGIDVDVKNYEVDEINYYINEVNGDNSTLLKGSGFQHLNGQQALSFARIRKVGNGDYERTERQRIVLKCLMDKAKQVDPIKITQLFTTLISYVQTNVPVQKALSLGMSAIKFNGGIQNMRIPVDGYFDGQNVGGASVLVPDIKANAQFAREFIYNIKATANKDVPSYMQSNFHTGDEVASGGKPVPNIPDYRTHDVPLKSDDGQNVNEQTPATNTAPGTKDGGKTGTTPGTSADDKTGTTPGGTTPGGTTPGGNNPGGTQGGNNTTPGSKTATP